MGTISLSVFEAQTAIMGLLFVPDCMFFLQPAGLHVPHASGSLRHGKRRAAFPTFDQSHCQGQSRYSHHIVRSCGRYRNSGCFKKFALAFMT